MPKKLPEEKRALILKLREEGKSFRKIQEIVGVSKSSLSYIFSPGQKDKTIKRSRTYRANLKDFVNKYKEEKGCQDCRDEGYPGKHPYYVLDADHVRGVKLTEISKMYRTNTIQETLDELDKCDIVCANHHRIRTYKRRITRQEIEAGRE